MSKLEALQKLDHFCVSDYNQMFFKKHLDNNDYNLNPLIDLLQTISTEIGNIFNQKQRTLQEMQHYSTILESFLSQYQQNLEEIAKSKPDHPLSPKKNWNDQEQIQLFEKIEAIMQKWDSTLQPLMRAVPNENILGEHPRKWIADPSKERVVFSFSEKNYFQLYEHLRDLTDMGKPNKNLNEYQQEFQKAFQEMMLAFQLVYHQIKFGQFYSEMPQIFIALRETAKTLQQTYNRYSWDNFTIIDKIIKAKNQLNRFSRVADNKKHDQIIQVKNKEGVMSDFKAIAEFIAHLHHMGFY